MHNDFCRWVLVLATADWGRLATGVAASPSPPCEGRGLNQRPLPVAFVPGPAGNNGAVGEQRVARWPGRSPGMDDNRCGVHDEETRSARCHGSGEKRWGRRALCLEARKGGKKDEMDKDIRLATRDLKRMEERKERKTQERARRRQSVQQRPRGSPWGDATDKPKGSSSRAVSNPLKKTNVVSNFDVNDVRKIEFVGSFVDDMAAWPQTDLPEIAFLGRSNVGKSSMLNTLFGEAVAKVSKTPGRTRQINIFKAKNSKGREVCYFADLPGYGYAKMAKETQRTIEVFLQMYLTRRSNLKLLVLLTDARREPLELDAEIIQFVEARVDRPYKLLVVATKVDKLTPMESAINIRRLTEAFDLPPEMPIQFSALTGRGKKDIWSYIRQAAAGE